jgi:curved DNA-binding protein CbpA
MKNRRNYYRILQVQPDAPFEIIRASYRTQMRELRKHPDLGGSVFGAAVLNEAYETLSNPERRAEYDKKLSLKTANPRQVRLSSRQPAAHALCPFCKTPLPQNPEPGAICSICRTPIQSAPIAPSFSSGKRTLSRTRHSEQINYCCTWPAKTRQGAMVDFSPKGMRFVSEEKLVPKTVLKISSRFFEASGVITNSQEKISGGQKQYMVGVCFIAVNFTNPRGNLLSTSG